MGEITLEQIYREYHEKLTCLVVRKVGDSSETEDLVEDIFLKLSQNLDRYDPQKASLSTWIYTVANRYIVDYYRTRKTFVEIPEESGEEGSFPEALIDSESVDSNLLLEDELNELADALSKLKQKERDLIILYYYKELTLKEAAEVMGMSYANAKVLHRKAIMKLGEQMRA